MTTAYQQERARRIDRRSQEIWEQMMRGGNSLLTGSEILARARARAERDVDSDMNADRERVFRRVVDSIMPAVDRHEPAALTEYLEAQADRHDTTIIWQRPSVFPKGAAAFADLDARRITLPIIEPGHAYRFAVGCHEQGHICAGKCGGSDHFVDPYNKDWHRCLACETEAWAHALKLAPASCLDLVHDRLRSSLEIYRESTPGPREAFRKLEELRGGLALRIEKQKRVMGLDYYRQKLNQWRTA